ncbi:MAG TPA: hypothetical protein VE056_00925 [Pyrinomonadaceae bacterium]|nr:hypothetical protein [Pyrinomonadaceae bacterium]
MKVALGLKAHSGWAALVVIGNSGSELQVIDRRRIELVEEKDSRWAKQPYHAAEALDPDAARDLVKRATKAAYRTADREMRATMKRLRKQEHKIVGCAVLVPNPMPEWSVDQILAVHFRMHQAEGVLFPEALARAANKCGLNLITIPEKILSERAEKLLATPLSGLTSKVTMLGKTVGPPWGKDQKNAALAAMVALQDT